MPLSNQSVLVTRAVGQNKKLIDLLQSLGAKTIELPTIKITWPDDLTDLDEALTHLSRYHWLIFSSVNGVAHFWQRLLFLNISPENIAHLKIGAIGPATASQLTELGLVVTHLPREHIAEALVESIENVTGQRILIPTANIARPALADGLRQKGAIVDQVTAYQTRPAAAPADLAARLAPVNILTFTSSSTVDNFGQMLKDRDLSLDTVASKTIACIGPKTADSVQALGLPVHVLAAEYTVDGLVAALVQHKNQFNLQKD